MSLFILASLSIWLALHLVLRSKSAGEPFMISHRGAAGLAPENTLAGISEAIDLGAMFVEADVQRSADGALVLMHDRTVDRTTDGTGRIAELTRDEIGKLDAGIRFPQEYAGEPVPSLDSVLELVAERGITLVLEAKNPSLYPGIEYQIIEALERFEVTDQVIVASFDHEWLSRFHESAPEVGLGEIWIWMGPSRCIPSTQLTCVHWASVLVDPTLVRRGHGQGHRVVAWTIDSAWWMDLLLWLGVDGITTNRPDLWDSVR